MKKTLLVASVLTVFSLGVAWADNPKAIARELSQITVPAVQAVQKAEQLLQGQTYDVDLESNFMGSFWEVKMIASDQRLLQAYVDGNTGEVVSVEEEIRTNGGKQKIRTQYRNDKPIL